MKDSGLIAAGFEVMRDQAGYVRLIFNHKHNWIHHSAPSRGFGHPYS
jgi:hypothetical protein